MLMGRPITTEFVNEKAKIAKDNLSSFDLLQYIEIRTGDDLKTLLDLEDTFDMLLLDGSKELYLNIFKLMIPRLRKGAVIIADKVSNAYFLPFLKGYLEYIADERNGLKGVLLPYPDGQQYCVKL